MTPYNRTFVVALQACGKLAEDDDFRSKLKNMENGKLIYADAYGKGWESDVFICCTLISLFGKCGSIPDAENVFDGLSTQNVVLRNAMLAAYTQEGRAAETLQFYGKMRQQNMGPNALS